MGNKRQVFHSTIEGCVSQFWEDLDTIASDINDTLEAMPESFQSGNRYSVLDDAKSSFEAHSGDAPDVPEFLGSIKLDYLNDTRAREAVTYKVRRGNMCAMLQGAIDETKNKIENPDDEMSGDDLTEAEELVEKLEEVIIEIEGIQFD